MVIFDRNLQIGNGRTRGAGGGIEIQRLESHGCPQKVGVGGVGGGVHIYERFRPIEKSQGYDFAVEGDTERTSGNAVAERPLPPLDSGGAADQPCRFLPPDRERVVRLRRDGEVRGTDANVCQRVRAVAGVRGIGDHCGAAAARGNHLALFRPRARRGYQLPADDVDVDDAVRRALDPPETVVEGVPIVRDARVQPLPAPRPA